MARIYSIEKKLQGLGIDEKLIKEITGGDLIDVTRRMEELLEPDLMRTVLDSCGCSGGREYLKKCEETGRELSGKSIAEKIGLLNTASKSEKITVNNDGSLTAALLFRDGEKYKCMCSAPIKKGVKASDLASENGALSEKIMPLSYCLCCAGAFRRHLQLKLGAELRTKEIVSSPINSRGEKPCEFILEIMREGL